ncbi:helix-turn-helix transcriptional regulator [Litoreibacter arenae]|uniref:Transcriptional activator protein raiR n=1 Tax=Litoreibacter arenae DSM 19593 TaxID=1123360 RepID=S9S5U2_9RHOB|nr:autoinducer binding domain-containing protein [Litoreibacter arenae]EPX81564.1 Transcriptional activator protein raiR [Litoreibacter arenae DSM 19593]
MQEVLSRATTLEEVQTFVEDLRDVYDLEHLVYHSVNSTGGQYAALTYDQEWVQRYLEQGYARIDPVVQGCYRKFQPTDWKALDWSAKGARSFLGEAVESGLGNQGFSVPIRGPSGQFAVVSVNHKCTDDTWANFTGERAADLLLISHYLNEKALQIEGNPERGPTRALSPREKDTLCLLASGANRANIAETLKISESTLRVYIESARFKLGATNTTHAVAMALTHGLIVV